MFAATDSEKQKRVYSIGACADELLLKRLSSANGLICPGCGQLVSYRRGSRTDRVSRRPHFTHRRGSDCRWGEASADLNEAKAAMFEWLEGKYPSRVSLDARMDDLDWDRPADLLIETGKSRVYYWILDRIPQDRWELFARVRRKDPKVAAHAIPLSFLLNYDEEGRVLLSAGLRDLMVQTAYDTDGDRELPEHLTFFDPMARFFIILRGLSLVHSPNVYRFALRREFPIMEALVTHTSGEILCREDTRAKASWDSARAARATESDPLERAAKHDVAPPQRLRPVLEAEPALPRRGLGQCNIPATSPPAPALYTCEDCSGTFAHASVTSPGKATCVCNACLAKRHAKKAGKLVD